MERAKQKALELIGLFNGFEGIGEETAKKCALICVNEVLYEASRITEDHNFYFEWVKKYIEDTQTLNHE